MAKYSVEELKELFENASACNIDGEYFNVHYLDSDIYEGHEKPSVIVYYVDNMCIYDYNYTLEELTQKDVKVYENREITMKDNKIVQVENVNV